MKKIIFSILIFISIVNAENKIEVDKNYNIVNYPYDLELVINYIKTKNPEIDKKYSDKLLYIYAINNNNKVKEKIKKILKKDIAIDKTTYAYALIDDKNLNKSKKSLFYELIKSSEDGNLQKIQNISTRKLKKMKSGGVLLSIKSFSYKDSNEKEYSKLKKVALKELKNELLFYYIIYKYDFIYENYISGLEYLKHINRIKPYVGINEDIRDICILGTKKYIKNEEYEEAWLMAKEGIIATKKLNKTKNINTLIQFKKDLVLSSKKIIAKKNKNKNYILYIIKETENLLKIN